MLSVYTCDNVNIDSVKFVFTEYSIKILSVATCLNTELQTLFNTYCMGMFMFEFRTKLPHAQLQ
jgi:hypothetical protein